MSLWTGEIIVRRTWSGLPIPLDVINIMDELAANEPEYEDDPLDFMEDGDEIRENVFPHQAATVEAQMDREEEEVDDTTQEHNEKQEEEAELVEEEINETDDVQNHGYNLSPNRARDYAHPFTFLAVQAGLKRFGQRGKDAILD